MTKQNKSTSWDLVDDPSLDPETKKNVVHNTTEEVREMPILGLVTAMPGGIEASERRGQEQFVASDILPTDIREPFDAEQGSGRKLLLAWGFTFGKVVDGDPMFTQARLPPGWKKKGSSHDMWSSILDDQGRERCSIFYKAAFYDRSAFLNITPRYTCDLEYEDEKLRHKGRVRGIVKDGERILFTGEWRKTKDGERDYTNYDAARKDAHEWREKNLPKNLTEQWELV